MQCGYRNCSNELTEGKERFCSPSCKNTYHVDKRRKKLKTLAMQHLGGKCERCGYSKCHQALEFHHRDPTQKDFGIGHKGYTRAWEKVRVEIEKCVLVCSNCHREIHAELQLSA